MGLIKDKTTKDFRAALPEIDYVVTRLSNPTDTAEGSILPRRLIGGNNRVPIVTGLRILSSEQLSGTTVYTLTWDEPGEDLVSHYVIYASGVLDSEQLANAGMAVKAPAKVRISAAAENRLTFYVQTVLKNGQVSDILSSPTCVGTYSPIPTFSNIKTVTANYTVEDGDVTLLADTSGGAFTITLPAVPTHGRTLSIKTIDATFTVTIDGNGNDIDGAATLGLVALYAGCTIQYDSVSAAWWVIY